MRWSFKYQQKHGIKQGQAKLPDETAAVGQHLARRVYRTLDLSGYARIDSRMDESGKLFVLEANPIRSSPTASRARPCSSGSSTPASSGALS